MRVAQKFVIVEDKVVNPRNLSLFLSLRVCLSFYLSLCLFVHLFIYLFMSVRLLYYMLPSLSIYSYIYFISINKSVNLSMHQSVLVYAYITSSLYHIKIDFNFEISPYFWRIICHQIWRDKRLMRSLR